MSDLLNEDPLRSKYIVSGGYESGLLKYYRDWERAPGTALLNTIEPAAYGLSFAACSAKWAAPLRGPAAACLSTGLFFQSAQDFAGLIRSTNQADTWYHGAALAADFTGFSGANVALFCHPRGRVLATLLMGIGLAGRGACELIPNRYVVQSIHRRDGTSPNVILGK